MELTTCTLCGQNTSTTERWIPSSIEKNKNYSYHFYPCCGYYKQVPFLSDEELNTIYEKDYEAFTRKGIFEFLTQRVTRRRAKRFRPLIQDKDVLEIGSSTGEFLFHCRNQGAKNVEGVEISQYASKIAREKYNLNIICSTFENFNPGKKFDAIFMFHVIEHVKNPQEVIQKCKSFLNKDGVLVMETPSWKSFESNFYHDQWVGWSVPFHTFIFSPSCLEKLTKRSGFNVADIHQSPLSNSYSFVIPFLARHRNILLLPFLSVYFGIRTLFASALKESAIFTIQASVSNSGK
ncbi:MAG TPA: class I SAM-dependent methyltransferase [Saprospiraceae bacterium]|nr:class I SAM-dependent methyltransferase [Saprospiraceae bacterium]